MKAKKRNTVGSEGEISNESEEDAEKEKTMKQRVYIYDKRVNSKNPPSSLAGGRRATEQNLRCSLGIERNMKPFSKEIQV